MSKNELAVSLGNSFSDEAHSIAIDAAEIGLDSILEDGLLKDIPFVSTVVGLYKIGKSIRERYYFDKLYKFIQALNAGASTEEEREKYRSKILEDQKIRNKEIEYLLVLIDRYIGIDKSRYLAVIYLSYLDGNISWLDVCKYAEVIDRFLPGDFELLKSSGAFHSVRDVGTDSLQRLIAQGLVIEKIRASNTRVEGTTLVFDAPEVFERSERDFQRTQFGTKLVSILCDERYLKSI